MGLMPRDRITVFMPVTHYHRPYLEQAIDCVFRQTRTDWRLLIVVDEDQQPHFRSLLREAMTDQRVRLIPNQGRLLAGAYNSAMRAAETSFIGVLLGDDLWTPDAVEILGQSIRDNEGVDFFYSGRCYIDGANQRLSSDYLPTQPVTAEGFATGSPVKHLLCWRVLTGLACGGVDETLNNFGSDDFDFPWTMLDHGAVFHPIHRVLYMYRDHRDGFRLTTHIPRSVQRRELRRILEKHGVAPALVRMRVRAANRAYLRQSLFRNHLHRWLRERLGFDVTRGWREPYR
jgi:glycosyltransferase involved in cell wall biosynthesis